MVKHAWGIIPVPASKKKSTPNPPTQTDSITSAESASSEPNSLIDSDSSNPAGTPTLSPAGRRFKDIAGRVGKQEAAKKQLENSEDRAIYTFTEALQAALAEGVSKKRIPWYILMPNSYLRRIWELALLFVLIDTLIFLPVREVFQTNTGYSTFDFVMDMFFIADVLLTFFSAYEDAWGDLVVDPKAIANNYLKGWFCIDVLSSFPFGLLPDYRYDQLSFLSALGKGLKIPRLIVRAFRMLKLMRAYKFRKFFYELEFSPLVHQGIVRAFKVLFVIFAIVHFSACLWYKVGDLAQDQNTGSWLSSIDKDVLDNASTGYLYLLSLYWATQTLTTVGYGDIVGKSSGELIVAMIIMTIGATTFSYITATVSSIIQSSDEASSEFRARMHKVSHFLNEKQLPPRLQVRVIREVGSYYRKAVSHSHNWVSLMEDMPAKLQKDVIAYTLKDILKISSFVRQVNDVNFHTELFASCEEIYLQPGQYLATAGFLCDSWYFVRRGVLAAVSSGNSNMIYRKYSAGQSLGESCIFLTTTWFASIRCIYASVVLRLPIQKLLRIAGSYEGITPILIDLATTDYAKLCLAKKNLESGSQKNLDTGSPSASPKDASSKSLSVPSNQLNRYRSTANLNAGLSDLSVEESELKATLNQTVYMENSPISSHQPKVDSGVPERISRLQTMIDHLHSQTELLASVANL